jgi:periplasmic protein TonB
MSEKPFVRFLLTFMASAVPVFGAAILFSLAVAGREPSRSPVKLPQDVAQSSSHAKPAWQLRIDPDRPLLANLLAHPDLMASAPRQPENVRESNAGYDSNSPTGELNVAPKSAVLPMSEGNARERTETDPTEPMRDTLEGNATTSTRISLETVPGSKAQKPASRSTKKPNGSAYGAGVYAALGRHKPSAVERGSATVSFSIDADGALSNVRIGQSSSNVQLDQKALQLVRDAAPFSPPPHGRSSYTIRIDFR